VTGVIIAAGFPEPARPVRYAFTQLQYARDGSAAQKTRHLGDIDPVTLPRPWDPPTCPPVLRSEIWNWLDRVAAWINHEYTWQTGQQIPSCWPAHPDIAHELAVAASLRYDARVALRADAFEDWHRYTLPGFLNRMADRLGPSPCPPGRHKDWPGRAAFKDYQSASSADRRRQTYTIEEPITANPHPDTQPDGARACSARRAAWPRPTPKRRTPR
jgi:hypothetical protein